MFKNEVCVGAGSLPVNSELQTLAPLFRFGLRFFFIPFQAFLSLVTRLLDLLESSSSRVEQALVFFL